ncbi:MAG TPA: HAMP domain-containing sensor histidine kinase [Solirubrobacterales bacterium]|nr:HAMP domain-containing sensor histidine kinase [Solirubrobacterales bacterium]
MLHLPRQTVRLRLTLLYSGLFLASGVALLVVTYLIFRGAAVPNLIVVPSGAAHTTAAQNAAAEARYQDVVRNSTDALHHGLLRSVIVLGVMTLISIALGWLVAGRVLRPLRVMTDTTRKISERNLHERLALPGPRDELKDLADTIDGLLVRLEAHVAEQQRFAANASHELRTPLAVTQTLLEVARADPNRDDGELVERLSAVNTRAIDLVEALLLLSRAGQRSFARERVDLSLLAEEAAETLLPLAEKRGVTIETSGGRAMTVGSHALLLQLCTNLVQNAVVHNLPDGGTASVTTAVRSTGVVLTVENTGEKLTQQMVSTLTEPFLRGRERTRSDHAGLGLGLTIVQTIAQAHEGNLVLEMREGGGLRATVELPAATPDGQTPPLRLPRR